MGCTSSKLDDLPAVKLCRDRCAFLDEAIHQRYALAEAHVAYIHSLKGIGHSLHNFIEQGFVNSSSGNPPLSPHLNLPPQRKGEISTKNFQASISPPHRLSRSDSGSHLHFHSDSDDESDHFSPLHLAHGGHIDFIEKDEEGIDVSGKGGEGFMHMNYMKKKPTTSVVYEQRPFSPEKVYHMGESSSSSVYSYPYSNVNSNPYPYNGYPNYGGGYGGYYGSSSPPPAYMSMSPDLARGSSSMPPPRPPSPPRASPWDFMNLFDTSDKYYSAYNPSMDSKEVREEEGIPDLEYEDYQGEVVKEVDRDQKYVKGGGKNLKAEVDHEKHYDDDDEDDDDDADALHYHRKGQSAIAENDKMEYEVHVVDKEIDNEKRISGHGGNKAGRAGSRDAYEVVREIEVQFEKASESGKEIAQMLEVGKLPYHRKHVSSKLLHAIAPSLSIVASQPSSSKGIVSSSSDDKAGAASTDIVEDIRMRSTNLSSTLQKLYLWEKKLYNEVKAEEKMRIIHETKCEKLKRLDERGAEAQKVDSTRNLIRSLSTKIRISIQIVDKISVTINKIRDEELWPQLNEFIQGLARMWKSMLECHNAQYQAMKEAKNLSPITSCKNLGDAHLRAISQLEHELVNWTFRFSSWISAQKGYIRALNNWLLKCLLYEPEETADGIAPFSPSRIGAPPVFIICNQWSQALESVSENEVIDSMRVFTMNVLLIWENEKVQLHQKMLGNKDLERKARNLEKEDQKLHKKIQAMNKIVLVSGASNDNVMDGKVVYQSETSNSNLQAGLLRIFEEMEVFTANSMKVYEELLQRSEEERISGEQEQKP